MGRSISLSIVAMALLASLAVAEPEVIVTYRSGVPVIQLTGSYSGASYTIYRAAAGNPDFRAITADDVTCLGECAVYDYDARPGYTYFYRFDLSLPSGEFTSYGPFAVTISREQARAMSAVIFPNPGRGAARVSISLAGPPDGAPVAIEAALFDLEGRALRTLHRGALARGTTTLEWDGRDGQGRSLGPGLYFLRLRSAVGLFTTPVIRTR